MYTTIHASLTPAQLQSLKKAIQSESSVTLAINPSKSGEHRLAITNGQKNKLLKGKVVKLTFSKAQLKHMTKEGGFLQFLAPIALAGLASLAAHGGKKLGEKVFGKGLYLPGAVPSGATR